MPYRAPGETITSPGVMTGDAEKEKSSRNRRGGDCDFAPCMVDIPRPSGAVKSLWWIELARGWGMGYGFGTVDPLLANKLLLLHVTLHTWYRPRPSIHPATIIARREKGKVCRR